MVHVKGDWSSEPKAKSLKPKALILAFSFLPSAFSEVTYA